MARDALATARWPARYGAHHPAPPRRSVHPPQQHQDGEKGGVGQSAPGQRAVATPGLFDELVHGAHQFTSLIHKDAPAPGLVTRLVAPAPRTVATASGKGLDGAIRLALHYEATNHDRPEASQRMSPFSAPRANLITDARVPSAAPALPHAGRVGADNGVIARAAP